MGWGRRRQSAVSQFPLPVLPQRLRRLSTLDFAVLAWLFLGFVSLIWTQYRSQAVTELRVMMVEPVLFYAILRWLSPDRRALLRLTDTLVTAGITVAVIGLVMFVQGQSVITAEEGARRLASVYGSPNNVGLFLGRCIPFVLAFAILPLDKRRRIVSVIALGLMGIAALLTQSAGALFVGIPAAVVTVLILTLGRRARLILAALVVILLFAFVVSLQSARFARILDFTSGTNFFRIRVWQSAVSLIQDYPVTGVGLDQFLYFFRGRYIMPDAWQEPNLSHPHNFVLDFWVRLGILGVVVFLWMQVAFWTQARRAYQSWKTANPLVFALVAGAIGSMVNLLAHGLIDNSVYVQDLAYVFVFLLMLVNCLSNIRAIDAAP
jgi:O-antigen ligase